MTPGEQATIIDLECCKEVILPLYEYACAQCGQHMEKIRKFSDPPLTKCEKCGGKLKQLLSSPAIRFKGTGWYITDYAKRSSTPAGAAADSGNGDKGKSTEAVKTEASSAKSADNKTVAEKKS